VLRRQVGFSMLMNGRYEGLSLKLISSITCGLGPRSHSCAERIMVLEMIVDTLRP
jgi:hypothetical protein